MKGLMIIMLTAALLSGCSVDAESLQASENPSDFLDVPVKKEETMKQKNESKEDALLEDASKETDFQNEEQRSMVDIEKMDLDLSSISEQIDQKKLSEEMNRILHQAETAGKAVGNPLNIHWGNETGQNESIETEE